MAPHSSTLAWKIPRTEEPGRTVHGVAKSRTRLSNFTFTFMHWRRKWQPIPVLLPGKSHGRWSMVGYSPWGRKELDMTEQLHCLFFLYLEKGIIAVEVR